MKRVEIESVPVSLSYSVLSVGKTAYTCGLFYYSPFGRDILYHFASGCSNVHTGPPSRIFPWGTPSSATASLLIAHSRFVGDTGFFPLA